MEVYQLDDDLWFPAPYEGTDEGLIAIGGDLSVERLLLAYSNGIFPWFAYKYKKEPWWYCPLDRYVIFPKEIHVSHSMKQLLRQNKYEVTFNQNFEDVIRNCSTVNQRNEEGGAWLGPDIIEAYTRLHQLGYAVSVEVWEKTSSGERNLVGGLYGISLKNAFFGESMFSLASNTSKYALITLARFLEKRGAHFIDCQFETSLFKSLGGRHISWDEYMEMLDSEV